MFFKFEMTEDRQYRALVFEIIADCILVKDIYEAQDIQTLHSFLHGCKMNYWKSMKWYNWNKSSGYVSSLGDSPKKTSMRGFRAAIELGYERPKWWQYWRWTEKNSDLQVVELNYKPSHLETQYLCPPVVAAYWPHDEIYGYGQTKQEVSDMLFEMPYKVVPKKIFRYHLIRLWKMVSTTVTRRQTF